MADLRGRASHRQKEWDGGFFGLTGVATTGTILLSFTSDDPVTWIRSRGVFLAQATPNAAADDTVLGLGLIVVSGAAFTAGAGSIPNPIVDFINEWIWH